MKLTTTAIALVLAAGVAAPAAAQYGPAAPQQQTNVPVAGAEKPEEEPRITPSSKKALEAIIKLQEAVKANDVANIPARVAAAQAVAKSAEDRYLIAALRYQAAGAANDDAAKAAAIEELIATGLVEQDQLAGLYAELTNAYNATQQKDRAAAALAKLLAIDPNNVQAAIMQANLYKSQGQAAQAVAQLQKSIAAASASGAKADERLYRHAVQLAYDARLPSAMELSRKWITAYPNEENWRNALRLYRNLASLDEAGTLDALRLARATGTLAGDADFHRYAYLATARGFPGEAKAVIDDAIAAQAIDPNKQLFKDIVAEVNAKAAGDRATMAQAMKAGLAAADAKKAVTAGDLHYGYGEYAKAAELYRAALGKAGADTDLINLHLGMALARAGDTAGATAALNAVGGSRAELAKYWLVYLKTRG